SVNDFSRSVGTKCTVDKIQYLDPNGKARSIDCFFQSGPNKGLSKGLNVIAKELGIAQPEKFKLPALRDHLSTHPAFQNQFVRKYSDQTFPTLLKNIVVSREEFSKKDTHLRSVRRFWKALQSYKDGVSYADVMRLYLSSKCDGTVKSHTRISNTKL
ncbi:unnamed protein product, partial [Rotaria socialis]